MDSRIERIIQQSIDKLSNDEQLLNTILNNEYLMTTVKYNNKEYVMVDCETRFPDIAESEYLLHVKEIFGDWMYHEKNNGNKEYNC